jgi:hypothetical protein
MSKLSSSKWTAAGTREVVVAEAQASPSDHIAPERRSLEDRWIFRLRRNVPRLPAFGAAEVPTSSRAERQPNAEGAFPKACDLPKTLTVLVNL